MTLNDLRLTNNPKLHQQRSRHSFRNPLKVLSSRQDGAIFTVLLSRTVLKRFLSHRYFYVSNTTGFDWIGIILWYHPLGGSRRRNLSSLVSITPDLTRQIRGILNNQTIRSHRDIRSVIFLLALLHSTSLVHVGLVMSYTYLEYLCAASTQ